MQKIKLGKYRHFKGGEYEVLGVAKHSETLDELVIYKALHELKHGEMGAWVRPLEMFFDTREHQGETVPQFTFMGD